MQRINFAPILKSMPNSRLVTMLMVFVIALVGGVAAINLKLSLLLLAISVVILLFVYFDIYASLYLLALIWWLPLEVNRFFPLQTYLGPWVQNLAVSEILAYIGLAAALLLSRRIAGRILSDPVLIFLAMLIVGGILAAGNIKTDAGIVMFRRSTFYFAAVILLCKGLLTDRKMINRVLTMVMVSGLLFCSYILFVQFFGESLLVSAGHYEGSSRIGGVYQIPLLGTFYFGPNNIGIITAVLAVLSFAMILMNISPLNRVFIGGSFLINTTLLVLTGSRASMASALFVGALLVSYLLLLRKKGRVVAYSLIIVIVIAVLIPQIASPEIMKRMQYLIGTGGDPYQSLPTRLRLFEQGIQLFAENPLGIGYATFVTMQDNAILWEQNLLLNTALGAGILGLIGLVGFYAFLFLRGFRKLILSQEMIPISLFAGTFAFFVNSQFTDPNIETCVYFCWLILGIAFAVVSGQTHTSIESPTSYTRTD